MVPNYSCLNMSETSALARAPHYLVEFKWWLWGTHARNARNVRVAEASKSLLGIIKREILGSWTWMGKITINNNITLGDPRAGKSREVAAIFWRTRNWPAWFTSRRWWWFDEANATNHPINQPWLWLSYIRMQNKKPLLRMIHYWVHHILPHHTINTLRVNGHEIKSPQVETATETNQPVLATMKHHWVRTLVRICPQEENISWFMW